MYDPSSSIATSANLRQAPFKKGGKTRQQEEFECFERIGWYVFLLNYYFEKTKISILTSTRSV